MRFRWKLLILMLVISIFPVVSLRTFGIQNVRLMAEALISQVAEKQISDARHQLQLVINEYSKVIRTSREQAEMAFFYQTFEVTRILQEALFHSSQNRPSPVPDVFGTDLNEMVAPQSGVPDASSGNMSPDQAIEKRKMCFSVPSTLDAAVANSKILNLNRLTPIYQAVSQYPGNLILRQYIALQNGMIGVYPCEHEIQHSVGTEHQIWYRSAFEEKATAWSRPYADPISGQTVMVLSYPVLTEDEDVLGVTGLLVPLNSLLEQALQLSDVPPGLRTHLCTLALRPSDGTVGARISASAQLPDTLPSTQSPKQESQWLASSNKEQFRAMLEDIARRLSGIREMPFNGRMSFWAYGPLLHQGSAFVFIVPRDHMINLENHPILESIRRRLNKVENYTGGFLLLLIALASVAALAFSRTVTRPLAKLSAAARKLSGGDFEARVPISSSDEFGDMGRIFNSIGPKLKQHYHMRRSLEVAEEIQQNLLPGDAPKINGLDIFGMTLFSDETGGDYFDYLCEDEAEKDKLCVTVGDVAGHGIPSALLMATARGFLRLRATIAGTLGEVMSDINREFTKDVENSGQFMTMFLARIDRGESRIEWVRAGHDPAILYDPDTDSFSTMNESRGLALGVTQDTIYRASSRDLTPGQIIILGTDGIWEARNSSGELFGKERLQHVLHAYSRESARTIVLSVLDAVEDFRGMGEQEDDITLVVIKITRRRNKMHRR